MNDFDEEQRNGGYNQNNQQNNYGTYYTPPRNEQNAQNNAYNYSNNSAPNGEYNSYYSSSSTDDGSKPPKKSKAGKIVAIVAIVCIFVAIAGIVASVAGYIAIPGKEVTTQSQEEITGDSNDVQTQQSNAVPTEDNKGNLTVAGVAEKCMQYCVGITVYSNQADVYNYFYGYGQSNSSGSSEPSKSGEGSGVIMSEANGKTYIITCAHVISDGDSFKVTLNDKKEYDASLVAYDAQTDIGVLSIDKTGLPIAEFADSDQLVVGEQVVAIGCPGGLEFMNSVTSGYISALDRPISSSIGYDNNCIQIDAAINPGNSGGALFNMQGQVIGINSSKIASTEYEGMGFAVPSSTAISTANSLIKAGYVEGRAKLGIQYNPLTSFNNSSAILNALEQQGYKDAKGTMVINNIDDESDLKNKDVKQYDMIVAVNGKTMTSTDVMTSILADSKPGDTIKLTIARIENNEIKIKEIECKLIESKG
ncbi:MAG: S1C family serine protease [Eubacterium sp.]